MEIRQAFPNEVDTIVAIIEDARQQIAAYGGSQWQIVYPTRETIFEDILTGVGYVALVEGIVAGYAAVIDGQDPAYAQIYDGKWQHNNHRYITFHRVAVSSAFKGQGIAQTFLQGLIEGQAGPDFRIDTHEQNKAMQHIVEKLGFVYCGKVPIDGERLAYQKIKTKAESALYQEVNEADYHAI
ncbi:GNAT family N-acetyltransferase [Streptococcus loxodontisalivarius]|uniref:GNAT superfamily N-acetyltransferase n=1 Tax=Streptococcus loxodontisalivarius TaxID=1349415 RepID=A0ABS2PU00_9STRE|nr:GNAT family N-acetyltransferase [Streptococcus loxodontisalivarius]MBM7643517.1 GNAT superfamily N-acetyltransferase [Streptococcus loxodontisalivarius]